MPRQVFAEDIERLIRTLDGVVAARVSTTPAGDIDQIYVSAGPDADVRAVRRGIGTALVSTYGLSLDPWRIQIAQPRTGPHEPPRFRVLRIEETVAEAETTALVQLAWTRGGPERVVTGRARGPLGTSHRLRTLAAAALDGAKEALAPEYRKLIGHEASLVTFHGRPTALAGISVATPHGDERVCGVAQGDASADAIVYAALDAVAKLGVRALEAAAPDRRAALDAMRRHVVASERAPSPAGSQARGAGPADGAGRSQAARPDGAHSRRGEVIGMTARRDAPEADRGPSGPGRLSIEEVLYQSLIANRTPVHIRCRGGYELRCAVVRDIDTHSVLVEIDGVTELVYKHAILSIRPVTDAHAEA